MVHNRHSKRSNESGFALLMSLIVVGVLISIGLTVLELTITQVRLSTNARASEVAFNSANAGMECARYWRRVEADTMEHGQTITPDCFSGTLDENTNSEITDGVSGDGEVFEYDYSFTWGSDGDRCTDVTTLVASSTSGGGGVTVTEAAVRNVIAGYPSVSGDWECDPGERCTLLSVQGYNQPCDSVSGFGTVQREVLLQF